MCLECVAMHCLNCILRPGRATAVAYSRNFHDVGETVAIAVGDSLARNHLLFEDGELLDQDCGLQCIEARVYPDMDIVVLGFPLTVECKRTELVRQIVVVCEHRPAVAVATEWFGGIKARTRDIT